MSRQRRRDCDVLVEFRNVGSEIVWELNRLYRRALLDVRAFETDG
ncbi:MAG: hypothetical protein M2R45_02340 [Verrucomicrobia subdivision 3 bacterium]|nr:hypothetical protein [Limisphaerales bacterium]MCS1414892.1 hypothetical protein [Limisphaerales bacterium]